MEEGILKLLVKKDFYQQYKYSLSEEFFSEELQDIFTTICKAHERFDGDFTLTEIFRLYEEQTVLTKASRDALNRLLKHLEDTPEPNSQMVGEIVELMHKKNVARQIGEAAIKIINGEDADFSIFTRLIEAGQKSTPDVDYDEVASDLPSLLSASDPSSLFPFRDPTLSQYVPGAGRGHNIIVLARPEVGKSSWVASETVGYLQRGLRVAYFGNEEPAYKILLNMVRSCGGVSDQELREKPEEILVQWDKLRSNLHMYESVGMTLADIQKRLRHVRADVCVLDQTDKTYINGAFAAAHERLKEIYWRAREIAKEEDCLMINVSQASAEAEGRREVTYTFMDNSKTGKAGEADIVLGIGKDPGIFETNLRYLTVSKNKINGWKGLLTVSFDPARNLWSV